LPQELFQFLRIILATELCSAAKDENDLSDRLQAKPPLLVEVNNRTDVQKESYQNTNDSTAPGEKEAVLTIRVESITSSYYRGPDRNKNPITFGDHLT
jgi:hypothetical protein